MRRLTFLATVFAIALPLTGCSDDEPVSMPDVVGKRLDVAVSDVERAGFDDEVEVLGGGTFGIVDESNWVVCSQEPANGTEITTAPRFTVDRSCGDEDALDPKAKQDESEQDDTSSEDQAAAPPTKRVKKKRRPAPAVAQTFVMPPLVGMNLQKAQDALQERGSFLLTQTDGTGQGRFQVLDSGWKVCAQDPAPGTVTDLATLVELVAVKLSEAC